MQKVKFIVSYDGTDYCGWQKQKEHKHASEKPSLQETVEIALSKLFNEPIGVNASGRTDAGVHAYGQVGDFETSRKMPRDFCWAVRSLLPHSIVIKNAYTAPEEFHSTLSAEKKTYRYWIWNSPRPTALLHRYSYWIRSPLDLGQLNSFAERLVGEKDFKSFQSSGTVVPHTVRKIQSARWWQRKPGLIEFEVTGNGFLKQMVRNLVGTQLDLAMKSQPIETIDEIIKARDRREAGPAAPPQGLFLWKVYYPSSLDKKCRRI
ncbi:MAG: tRNA pseudouridine(38-40) synthase TruA [Pseudobdellovibrionaceae bacterium]